MALMGMFSGVTPDNESAPSLVLDTTGVDAVAGTAGGGSSSAVAFGICNPHLDGCPLTHATGKFLELIGYTKRKAF
jgi:hypothetical protein